MPRSRSIALSGSRASDIVNGIRKQMGLCTPPPLSAPKAPLRELDTANVWKILSYTDASFNQPLGCTSINTEPIQIATGVVGSAMIIDEEMGMDWEFEQPPQTILQIMEVDMARQGMDIDGDVIMGEPDDDVSTFPLPIMLCSSVQSSESPEIEMASLPAYTFPSLDAPAPIVNNLPASVPSTLLASPMLVGESWSSSYIFSGKGKERALPSISEVVERCVMKSAAPSLRGTNNEDEGCVMKFAAPSLRAIKEEDEDEGCVMKFTAPSKRATTDEDLPVSSYMLGYIDGRPSSSVSTPDHGPKAVDAKVPILTI
jgi:hypothetical protein